MTHPIVELSPAEVGHDPLLAEIWRRIQRIEDPCHVRSGYGLSIADLGIINSIDVADGTVQVGVTYTESGCTFAPTIVSGIEDALAGLTGIDAVLVVHEPFPPWDEDRLSPRARDLYAERRAMRTGARRL